MSADKYDRRVFRCVELFKQNQLKTALNGLHSFIDNKHKLSNQFSLAQTAVSYFCIRVYEFITGVSLCDDYILHFSVVYIAWSCVMIKPITELL